MATERHVVGTDDQNYASHSNSVVCKHDSEVLSMRDRVVVVVVAVLRAGRCRLLDTTERRQHLRPAQANCPDGGRRPG